MRQTKPRQSGRNSKKRPRGPHHVIVARGEKVRSFAIRPGAVAIGAVLAILVISGALTATAYTFLKGDMAITSLVAQDAVRQDYEVQIVDLNRQIEALVSRHLVEREVLDNEVAELVNRQGELIERQQLLTGLASDALAVGVDVLPMLAPIPVANPLRGAVPPENGVGGPVDPTTTGGTDREASIQHSQVLAAIETTADWLEESQLEALATLAEAISQRTDQLSDALEALGHSEVVGGVGGPLMPLDTEIFAELESNIAAFAELQAFARTLPLAAPLTGLEVTSRFGRRVDPFTGQGATHTGVDFRAASGTTVLATGAGTIVTASTNGGYGKMVEVDHGSGVSTIYAHLSSISVRVGQAVNVGAIVGRVGSTGRSTGPHLHYEVNRAGRVVDPMPYLRT
ncbi:MAG: M23 family metallopeptidase, partial [Alphaproteobacteria bacterium]